MRKLIYIIALFSLLPTYSQDISSAFDNKKFELKHFIINGQVEELDLTNPNDATGNTLRDIPFIEFTFNNNTEILNAFIAGYCNGTSAEYKVLDNYLEVLERGGTTLMDCGNDESSEYFFPVKGQINWTENTNQVFYKFDEDGENLTLWINENHKLIFEEKVLSIKKSILENAIAIYPNPTKDYINIDINSNNVNLIKVSIIDNQGKEVIKKVNNLKTIDISKLASGIYFIKLKSNSNTSITRKIIKQ